MRVTPRPRPKGSGQVEVRDKAMMDLILESISEHYSLPKEMILCHSKEAIYTEPRHIVLSLGYSLTYNSQVIVGAYFGGKNHATVNHAMKNVINWHDTDANFRDIVNTIIGGLNYITDKTYSFQNVIDTYKKRKSLSDKQDALLTRLNKSIKLIANSREEISVETLRKLAANLRLVAKEVEKKQEVKKFRKQSILENEIKKPQTN